MKVVSQALMFPPAPRGIQLLDCPWQSQTVCGPHIKKISEEFLAQLGISEHGGSSLKQFGWHVPQQGNSGSKLQDSSSNEDVDSLEPSQEN